jgi:hypothetical protein
MDVAGNDISVATNSTSSDDVNDIIKKGKEVDGIFTPVEKAKISAIVSQ